MTALAGFFDFRGKHGPRPAVARMLAAQAHYATRPAVVVEDHPVALGRASFDLLPEDGASPGPVAGGGGRYLLAADIRLNNRADLAAALDLPWQAMGGLSDAALLMRAWERWEEECLTRLAGPFALILWDGLHRRLVLARDPLGGRPLHLHHGAGFVAVASMPCGLHALPEVPVGPDNERVLDWLACLPEEGPRSFFQDIERVESGQIVRVRAEVPAERVFYWNPSPARLRLPRIEDYVDAYREKLDQAVGSALRGVQDRVSCDLSAGMDSSAVTATAARLGKDLALHAFTAAPREGYDLPVPAGRLGDESGLAAELAAMYPNIRHHILRTGGTSPLDILDKYYAYCGRPPLNLANHVWVQAILGASRREGCRVHLTGAVGNYTLTYDGTGLSRERLRDREWGALAGDLATMLLNRSRRLPLLRDLMAAVLPGTVWRLLQRVRGNRPDLACYTALPPSQLARTRRRALQLDFDLSYQLKLDGRAWRLRALSRIDTGNDDKGALARHHLDVRDPTADLRLVEFCLSVPTGLFLHKGIPRFLPRLALADRVPAACLHHPLKGLQAVDWHEGLSAARSQVRDEIGRVAASPAAGLLDLDRLRRLERDWPNGGWHRAEVAQSYRLALLRGLSAGHFVRKAAGSNG